MADESVESDPVPARAISHTTPRLTRVMEDSALSQLLLDWDDAELAQLSEIMAVATGQFPIESWPSAGDYACTSTADSVDNTELASRVLAPREISMKASREAVSRSTLCRKRQREELQRLRTEAARLEKQLEDMRTPTRLTHFSGGSPYHGVWKRLATHQLERRRQGEHENTKLRDLIQAQSQVAKRLSKVLEYSQAVNKTCHEALQNARILKTGDPAYLERLSENTMSPWWPRIEHQLFQNNAFWAEDLDLELVRITGDASGPSTLESAFTAIFPFNLAATSSALWRIYSTNFLAVPTGHYEATTVSEEVLLASFDLTLKNTRGRAVPARSKFLVRRLQSDSERIVFVMADISSSVADHPDEGLSVKINACVCLDKSERLDMSESTRLRLYSLQSIVGGKREAIAMDELERSLGDVYCGVHKKTCRDVETFLVDESLQRRAGGVQV